MFNRSDDPLKQRRQELLDLRGRLFDEVKDWIRNNDPIAAREAAVKLVRISRSISGVKEGFPAVKLSYAPESELGTDTPSEKKDDDRSKKLLYDRKETAEILCISATTLHRLTVDRKIRPVRIGNRVFFDFKEITEFIERMKDWGKLKTKGVC